ncbi:carboxylesterase-lipase family protein [Sugiyamaella lignohabitans]|uniref:Carboxylic ester hydrolase n=1 Tax=Sugiyamaella lignohabitans TaxID=796027 RepID=A0A161HM45_9ASCO|nr:carboxylesterase-lipase family protein [Sugiyamaella lignohabitans]ANB14637.1 carboxylesterase-lipase family protein [Sugiyamaella lignohabitans]
MTSAPTIKRWEKHQLKFAGQGTLDGIKILEDDESGDVKCYRYTGVRYAQAPVGPLRWRRPQKLSKTYDYTGDYTSFKTVCPQPSLSTISANDDIVYDEDCLFANIWVPGGTPPKEGWPVLYFIHGGFLQVGSPHHYRQADPQDLLAKDSKAKYIIVAAGYRLNLFGFLSSKELLEEDKYNSNFGFWDQRMGMEWVYEHIHHFGGNKDNITVGGLSAGSYSAIFQLAYELYHPEVTQIIKRSLLLSNGLAIQPNTVDKTQDQFDSLLKELDIPKSLSAKEKLEKLRKVPFESLVKAIDGLDRQTFRAITDTYFVSPTLFDDIYSGKFGELVNTSGRSLMSGEVDNEWLIYSLTNAPDTVDELAAKIENYYPRPVTNALIKHYPTPKPDDDDDLQKVFGDIVSDMQVYVSSRLLVNSLAKAGMTTDRVFRYRIAFRGQYLDKYAPPEFRVPHTGDIGIWFYTAFDGITDDEKPLFQQWLEPVAEWITTGTTAKWGTRSITDLRVFNRDGTITITPDDRWDWAMTVGRVVSSALSPGSKL